mmetsp:Transcript_14570/g.16692  ORF Transcript_14570/g.16692 Transcript_14570/m.16692 type:complete len:106 (+) Transcript_14570:103-420(+)|eukprot:CAMPEP_0194150378 /NCGR_PEP_ID=MMETSP0152-20130528/42966_1 /TAXON_ID=1049557 /ORGANISM="Thalassiothrix antarctica, Strain L6-D1" /LENGTH=105 /DNA_ID=CAMNT_0038853281 /DNA_START=85 /DNA_END=402 /DNA_ORIENTATION=-
MVKFVKDLAEWNAVKEMSKTKLVVVDFTASWCPPCKMIAPIFEKMAEDNEDCEFVKVDVDENSDVASLCGISAMPTFLLYKGGEKVAEMAGANEAKLMELVKKHK